MTNKLRIYQLQIQFWRSIGLIIVLLLFYTTLKDNDYPSLLYSTVRIYDYKWDSNLTSVCGIYQSKIVDSKQRLSLITHSGKVVDVPVFSTHKLKGRVHPNVISAVLVQHGNLRNGRDYFCTSVNSLSSRSQNTSKYIILAPNFLSNGDQCWNEHTKTATTINTTDSGTWCDFQVFTSDGWRDGKCSVNSVNTPDEFYSYDVFNLLIELLSNPHSFPNLKTIKLFGFSAGGQTLLRYATLPKYNQTANRNPPTVQFVISDPSSYIYFDRNRPHNRNGLLDGLPTKSLIKYNNLSNKIPYSSSFSFGYPNSSWNLWKVDSSGMDWIGDWNVECSRFNEFRFGFDNMVGYFLHHASLAVRLEDFISKTISDFPKQDIVYLAGLNDTENCRLVNHVGCTDHNIESFCRAMLQGTNRLDRILKWKAYLNFIYKRDVHKIIFADGVRHDEREMVNSAVGGCVLFGLCDNSQ